VIPRQSRDRADDAILGCALAARAEFMVTGDDDQLSPRTFRGIRIVRPRDFEALFADLDGRLCMASVGDPRHSAARYCPKGQ